MINYEEATHEQQEEFDKKRNYPLNRIMQIARESHLDVYGLGKDREKWESTLQTFGELIVRECIVDYYRRYLDICSDEDITVQVDRYVKEHFGVEE